MKSIGRRRMSRREMLQLSLLGSAALLLPLERRVRTELESPRLASNQIPAPFQVPFSVPPVLQPVRSDDVPGVFPGTNTPYSGTDYYEVTMRSARVPVLPGFPDTEVYAYNGVTPGPTIVQRRGRNTVVRHLNDLPEVSRFGYPTSASTHLHGNASLPQYDGYASDVIPTGFYKDYHYPTFQDARTLWYHDHAVHHTAQNAYMGLAGFYITHDDLEESLPLPKGRYDVPLVLRDAIFSTTGQLLYDDQDHSSLMGDVILANGKPWPVMQVERRKYRFRLLNASISRSYRLTLNTGQDMTVIGTDGGLMPAPQLTRNLLLGMAERYEVVIDFSQNKVGDRVVLQNGRQANNIDFSQTNKVMRFDVVGEATDTSNNEVPASLNPDNPVMKLTAAQAVRTRQMTFKRTPIAPGTLEEHWTVNGMTWEDVVRSDYTANVANPAPGSIEVWNLYNSGGGWFHPVHIHLVDFRILSRTGGKNPGVRPYERGPKDTAYVGENETVKVVMKFGPHQGRYMMHCHNLVHEDHDMMTQFQVGASTATGDPIAADPAKPISEALPL